MTAALCRRRGIAFALFAFSHCRDVVAAVSRAGGMGVFGAVVQAFKEDDFAAAERPMATLEG